MGSELGERVAAIESTVASIDKSVAELRQGINALVQAEINGHKTPWGTIVSFLGVLLVIIGAVGNAWLTPVQIEIQNLNQRQDRIVQAFKDLRSVIETKK